MQRLDWAIREMEDEIDAGHGKLRVTEPETSISKVYLDEDDAVRRRL